MRDFSIFRSDGESQARFAPINLEPTFASRHSKQRRGARPPVAQINCRFDRIVTRRHDAHSVFAWIEIVEHSRARLDVIVEGDHRSGRLGLHSCPQMTLSRRYYLTTFA